MPCAQPDASSVYRPRASPLYRIVERHYPDFQRVYRERYQKRYGTWRPIIGEAVRKFLRCGDLHFGFARLRCPDCHREMMVAFSCRQRCICPSCHQKRALVLALQMAEDVCWPVPYRQYVWTIPKRLRIYFRYDRRLLGRLAPLAWQTVQETFQSVLQRDDVVAGMVAGIQTFGELIHFHPHLHAIVSDGAFTPEGTFLCLPPIETEQVRKRWEEKVFRLLL